MKGRALLFCRAFQPDSGLDAGYRIFDGNKIELWSFSGLGEEDGRLLPAFPNARPYHSVLAFEQHNLLVVCGGGNPDLDEDNEDDEHDPLAPRRLAVILAIYKQKSLKTILRRNLRVTRPCLLARSTPTIQTQSLRGKLSPLTCRSISTTSTPVIRSFA